MALIYCFRTHISIISSKHILYDYRSHTLKTNFNLTFSWIKHHRMDLFHLFNTWRTLSNIPHNSYIFLEIAHFTSYVWLNRLLIVILMFFKWIRYLHRSILKITYCLFIKCTFKIVKEVF